NGSQGDQPAVVIRRGELMNAFDRFGLPAACVVALAVFVFRLHVVRRGTGVSAVTYLCRRGASPLETALGVAWLALLLGLPLWVALYAWRGPDALGVVDPGPWSRGTGWILLGAGGLLAAIAQVHMGTSWRVGIDDAKTALVTDG